MVIFNQTFSEDKPIIFPSTWGTGKTQLQLYDDWKETLQFFFVSNFLQLAASSLFIFLMVVMGVALKQLHRISRLSDDVMEKKYNKKYLKFSFIFPIALIALMCLGIFLILMIQEWTRIIMLKGLTFCIITYSLYRVYKTSKPYFGKLKVKMANFFKSKEKKATHIQ